MASGESNKKAAVGKGTRPSAPLGEDDEENTILDPEMQKRMKTEATKIEEEAHKFPVPAGWDLRDMSADEFFTKVHDIQKAQSNSEKAAELALSSYGLESAEQFEWLRLRFEAGHAKDPAFRQAKAQHQGQHSKG
jgi:hypothetical protein